MEPTQIKLPLTIYHQKVITWDIQLKLALGLKVTATLVVVVVLVLEVTVAAIRALVTEMTLALVEWAQAAIKTIVILGASTETTAPAMEATMAVLITPARVALMTGSPVVVVLMQPHVVVVISLRRASQLSASPWV